jgi:hypothetical protein
MDPYLENSVLFPGLHDRLIAYISEALQPQLPAPYYADITDRVWYPVVVTVSHDEVREPFVQIFSPLEGERLVTVIEVLSPSNKAAGSKGRDLYLRKQREVLSSQTNFVEIDLLRDGEHTSAVPLDRAVAKAGRFDYHVCAHSFEHFEDFIVYPILIEQKLPEVAVPLLPKDPPVVLDLQAVFDRAYDTGPYERRLSYTGAPVPPLGADRERWAAGLLERARS